jgi:hypothetical protein
VILPLLVPVDSVFSLAPQKVSVLEMAIVPCGRPMTKVGTLMKKAMQTR